MNDKLDSPKPSITPSNPIAQETEGLEQDMLRSEDIQQIREKVKESRKWPAEQDRKEGRGTKDEKQSSPDPSTMLLPGGKLINSDSRTLLSDAPLPEEIEAKTALPEIADEDGRQNQEHKMDQPEYKHHLQGITAEEWATAREKIRQQEILLGKPAGRIPPDSPEEAVELERHRELGDTVGRGILPEKGGSSQPPPTPSPSAKHDDPLPAALLSDPLTPKKSRERLSKMLEENERYEALHHWGGETGRLYREMLKAKERAEEQDGKEGPKENKLGSPEASITSSPDTKPSDPVPQTQYLDALEISPEAAQEGYNKARADEIFRGKIAGIIQPDSPEEAAELKRLRNLGETAGRGILPEKGCSPQLSHTSPPNDNNDDSRPRTRRSAPLSPKEIMELRRAEEKNRFNRKMLEEQDRLLANPIKINCYRPKEEGPDLVLSILHGNENICPFVADKLWGIYQDDCDLKKRSILAYVKCEIYKSSNGLEFRLHDSGEGSPDNRRFTLGFSAPEHTGEAKTNILLEIPKLLRQSGVDNESALKKLVNFILPSQAPECCAFCSENFDDDNIIACRECQRWFCYRCGDWCHILCEHCLARRMIQIEAYKPKEGADLALRVYETNEFNSGENINTPKSIDISKRTAFLLHAIHSAERKQRGLNQEEFEYGTPYEFNNGVIFRAFDEGGYPRTITLEFKAAPECDKNATLPHIVPLLKQGGINDEDALNRLENFIKDKKTVNLPMLNG